MVLWKWFFTILCIGVASPLSGQQKETVVLIDPGHGGRDGGAVSVDGAMEKDIVLDIAHWMVYWNRVLYDDRSDIYLTRYNDRSVTLSDRVFLAGHIRPDVFISLHANHSKDREAAGIEVYVHTREAPLRAAPAEELGGYIAEGLKTRLGFRDRGLKTANFQVLRETKGVCPSLLLELGFLSNRDESGHLEKRDNRKALALALVSIILEHNQD